MFCISLQHIALGLAYALYLKVEIRVACRLTCHQDNRLWILGALPPPPVILYAGRMQGDRPGNAKPQGYSAQQGDVPSKNPLAGKEGHAYTDSVIQLILCPFTTLLFLAMKIVSDGQGQISGRQSKLQCYPMPNAIKTQK